MVRAPRLQSKRDPKALTLRVSLVVSDDEKEAFEDEAKRENRTVSNWMRTTLVERVMANRAKRGKE